jgi:hypothetical protein
MNSYPVYGSKFGLIFNDPKKLEDLYLGKIGSSNSSKIKAYYYDFDLEMSIEHIDYVELICKKTGANLTNVNLPKLGFDIMTNTEPYINILKMKIVIEQYLYFYKKMMDEAKTKIKKDKICEKISYCSSVWTSSDDSHDMNNISSKNKNVVEKYNILNKKTNNNKKQESQMTGTTKITDSYDTVEPIYIEKANNNKFMASKKGTEKIISLNMNLNDDIDIKKNNVDKTYSNSKTKLKPKQKLSSNNDSNNDSTDESSYDSSYDSNYDSSGNSSYDSSNDSRSSNSSSYTSDNS